MKEMKRETPQWVIEYNNANHQSSAGKAIKILMGENERMAELLKETVEALESVIRLKPLIDYPNNTKEKHIGEAMAISGMLHKVEAAIEKAKGKSQ